MTSSEIQLAVVTNQQLAAIERLTKANEELSRVNVQIKESQALAESSGRRMEDNRARSKLEFGPEVRQTLFDLSVQDKPCFMVLETPALYADHGFKASRRWRRLLTGFELGPRTRHGSDRLQ